MKAQSSLPLLPLRAVCLLVVAAALGLIAALIPTTTVAALRTFVEPRLVNEMDTIRLTIRQEGSSQSDTPDLAPLMEDFEVLGSQTSSRISSSSNGRTIASVEYQINLRPRRTGELIIPSVSIGGEQSQRILIHVRPLDPSVKQSIASMVFFETDLTSNPVYVQAETVLTRRLFYSQGVQIYSDLPGIPEIADAVVIPLGETQSLTTMRGSRKYGVIEQRFAVFPERSGALTIPAISVTSSVSLQSQGRTRRSGVRVSTEEIQLEVLSIPSSYPADAAWLPATSVSAGQRWLPAVADVSVGEPLNFEVAIRATGNRGSAIPPLPLPFPEDQFKIYPESPEMLESADKGTVIGTRRETFALIPTAPGRVSIPNLSVTWWDTTADQLRQTPLQVAPLLITGTPTPAIPEKPVESEAVAPGSEPPADDARTATAWRPLIGTVLVVISALLVLIGISRVLLPRLTVLGERFPGLDFQARSERRQKLKTLRQATRQSDPIQYRRALAEFLTTIYRSPATEALHRFRAEPDTAQLMARLDQAIYAGHGESALVVEQDFSALTTLARAAAARSRTAGTDTDLPALYS